MKNEIAKHIFDKKIPDISESLFVSCENENEEMVNFLIKNGANKSYVDPRSKKSLIHLVSQKVNLKLLNVICKKTIFTNFEKEMNLKDENGNTALLSIDYSLQKEDTLLFVKFLLNNKSNINLKNRNGESCLSLSCIADNQTLSYFFLKNGRIIFLFYIIFKFFL